jgi:malonate transporter
MHLIHSLAIIYVIIFIGAVAGKTDVFNKIQIEGFELFLFKIAIPCYLFNAVLTHNFSTLVNFQYVCAYLLSFIIVAILTAFCFLRNYSLSELCIKMLSGGYVNAAIYALPVITFLLGDPKAGILGNLIQAIIIQPVFLMVLSFIKHREKSIPHRLLKSFLNPMVAAPILAIVISYFRLNPTFIVMTVTEHLGSSANSLALFALGLNLSSISMNALNFNKAVILTSFLKNIAHPVIAALVGWYVFSLDSYWFYSLVIATSAPTAFIVYIISKQFSTDSDFVKLVVFTTSCISLIALVIISQLIKFNV